MIKKILLCTDGSSYSQEALKYAAWVSKVTGAEVTALYVSDLRRFELPTIMDVGGSLGIQPYQSLISSLQDAEKQKADLIEDFTRKAFASEGITEGISFKSETGLLSDTIEEFEKDFDLVILGKRGESAEHAMNHIGSTLERVVRASSRPCLVTNRQYREVKKVAFAFDDGASCRKLLSVLESSEWLKKLPIHLLSVAEDYENEGECAKKLKETEKRLIDAGYQVDAEMLGGMAEEAIADYVERKDIDLLLMGAYGHTRIRRFLIGSTTTEMLRRCKIPVLCFH
ncbi:universal stress protein [Puniceicoccus vermicola]|uniref:Universal stress protein n=1 Tax=Puniceicoccus vermicola TaxID=388746 RepID=A0A7X1E696_9BACT|nr:universal stress protein [Puniceicoccus vermicola]MBC2604009.1 universal stress protein [Puniceicoccus vermicola]